MARRISESIAALPVGITASVGTAYTPLGGVHRGRYQMLVDHLVGATDTAMYRAKRQGRNGFVNHGPGAFPQPSGGVEGEA